MADYTYNGPQNPETKYADDINGIKNNPSNGGDTELKDPASGGAGRVISYDVTEDDYSHLGCGYGSCKPECSQGFNNPKAILAVLSWFVIVQGFVVNGVNNVNTSTIERRFNLPSSQVGIISSAYDISAGLTVIFISYYGRHGNMPRWLGVAALTMALGSFIMSIPHFATGQYQLGTPISDNCPVNSTTVCKDDEGLKNYLYVLILGQLLHGLGGTTLYTIGVVYIDDNVRTNASPLYISIFEGMAALGPALGYIVGGALLNIYVDFDVIDVSSMNVRPTDPRWVGAWWIGFVTASCLFVTVALLLFCFGRETREAEIVRSQRISQSHKGSEEQLSKTGDGKSIKDLPRITLILLRNPAFMMLTLAGTATILLSSGFATFISKYIENQLYQTASWSAMLAGFVLVPSALIGQIAGGFISSKMKLKVLGMIRLCIISQVIALVASAVFFLSCTAPNIAGISVQYSNSSLSYQSNYLANVTATCNAGCGCTTESREPVCGIDNVEYFTACHAGCKFSNETDFGNCACIANNLVNGTYDVASMAKNGPCDSNCAYLPLFLCILFILIGFTLLPLVPSLGATLRCIPSSTRTFALGVQWVFLRFLGSIPGPILFGYVMDTACIVWQEKCNGRGSCWLYDRSKMSMTIFGLSMGFGSLALIFYVIGHVVYKPPGKMDNTPKSDSQDELELSNTDK